MPSCVRHPALMRGAGLGMLIWTKAPVVAGVRASAAGPWPRRRVRAPDCDKACQRRSPVGARLDLATAASPICSTVVRHPEGQTGMICFKVANMSCGGCARAVTAALRGVDPEAEISVDLGRREVAVASTARAENLAGALREAGFEGPALPA